MHKSEKAAIVSETLDELLPQTPIPLHHRTIFWLLSLILVAYVGVCTGNRDNIWAADAWEHHRAILALTQDLESPRNPTFDTPEPSIRYSPYSVALALVARSGLSDPWDALSAAAVLNTFLLAWAIWTVLVAFDVRRLGPVLLIVMVSLWGGPPGYANSYALADLPWHQVNPSALAFALSILSVGWFERIRRSPGQWGWGVLISLAVAQSLLSHGMTGLYTAVALVFQALARPSGQRVRGVIESGTMILVAVGLTTFWPYYDVFSDLLASKPAPYWFNEGILRLVLTQWCLPAALGALLALPYRAHPLVRLALIAGGACYLLGVLAFLARSATFARLPIPGTFFFHIAVSWVVVEMGLLRPRTWAARFRRATATEVERATTAVAAIVLAFALLYFLVPQLLSVLREPHLARQYVAPVLGREDRQLHLRARFKSLLEPVDTRDVVLSDRSTSWPMPSISGRIVTANHWEYWTPDQGQREADVSAFFSLETDVDRAGMIEKYSVRWIVLNPDAIGREVSDSLLETEAIVQRDAEWVLMDAREWLVRRRSVPD